MIESKMEELLIKQLTHGVSQWTYRPDLRTEEALWNNLREKLNRNNIDAPRHSLDRGRDEAD